MHDYDNYEILYFYTKIMITCIHVYVLYVHAYIHIMVIHIPSQVRAYYIQYSHCDYQLGITVYIYIHTVILYRHL